MNKKTFVEYLDGRRMFLETETREMETRNTNEALAMMPDYCYGFRFFDLTWKVAKTDEGEEFEVDRKRVNASATYYPGGDLFTLDRVRKELPEASILISNMENNDWDYVVEDRHGGMHAWDDGDQIIEDLPK